MKSFIAVFVLVAAVAADVSHLFHNNQQHHHHSSGPDAQAQIVRSEADVRPDGFQYAFETDNGISSQASGQLQNAGRDDESISVQGSDSYTSPEGQQIQITYVADQNGYQPQGAHLPTPPPPQEIPEYILRSIAYNEAHPQQPETGKRF